MILVVEFPNISFLKGLFNNCERLDEYIYKEVKLYRFGVSVASQSVARVLTLSLYC